MNTSIKITNKTQFTSKQCIHYFDKNELSLFFRRDVKYCPSICFPKVKNSLSKVRVEIQKPLDACSLLNLLSIEDLFNEITKYLDRPVVLSILSLNRIYRNLIINRFYLVFIPAELEDRCNQKLELAHQCNLKIIVKNLFQFTRNDRQRPLENVSLPYPIRAGNPNFLSRIKAIHIIYVNEQTVNAAQTLLNLIPNMPCLHTLTFNGIWRDITFPDMKLHLLNLGEIWSTITFTDTPKLVSLLFKKVSNEQPETKRMLEALKQSICSKASAEIAL